MVFRRTMHSATTNLCWNANIKHVYVVQHKVDESTGTLMKLTSAFEVCVCVVCDPPRCRFVLTVTLYASLRLNADCFSY